MPWRGGGARTRPGATRGAPTTRSARDERYEPVASSSDCCAICLGVLGDATAAAAATCTTPCRHTFHVACLRQWRARATAASGACPCPICRAPLYVRTAADALHAVCAEAARVRDSMDSLLHRAGHAQRYARFARQTVESATVRTERVGTAAALVAYQEGELSALRESHRLHCLLLESLVRAGTLKLHLWTVANRLDAAARPPEGDEECRELLAACRTALDHLQHVEMDLLTFAAREC